MPVGKVLVALSAPGYLKAAQSSHGCEGWQLRWGALCYAHLHALRWPASCPDAAIHSWRCLNTSTQEQCWCCCRCLTQRLLQPCSTRGSGLCLHQPNQHCRPAPICCTVTVRNTVSARPQSRGHQCWQTACLHRPPLDVLAAPPPTAASIATMHSTIELAGAQSMCVERWHLHAVLRTLCLHGSSTILLCLRVIFASDSFCWPPACCCRSNYTHYTVRHWCPPPMRANTCQDKPIHAEHANRLTNQQGTQTEASVHQHYMCTISRSCLALIAISQPSLMVGAGACLVLATTAAPAVNISLDSG